MMINENTSLMQLLSIYIC